MTQLQLGTYDAVANFNVGKKSMIMIFEELSMAPGYFTKMSCKSANRKRLYFAAYKENYTTKKRHKILRGLSKQYIDVCEEKEGTVYAAGGF